MKPRLLVCLMVALTATAVYAQSTRARTVKNPFLTQSQNSFLGVGVAEIDSQRAKALNLKEEYGVEVKSVESDSPAAKAGVKEGDVVLEYNGQRVEGAEQFIRLVHETPVGRQVKLLISRNGATQTLTAAIGKRDPGAFYFGDGEFRFAMPQITIPDKPNFLMSMRNSMLGIESESLSSQLAEFFGVNDGVLVRSVTKNSAADKAGIKAGDVITKINDTKVTSPRELSSELRASRSRKTVPVVIVRNRKEMTLTINVEDNSGTRGIGPLVDGAIRELIDRVVEQVPYLLCKTLTL